MSWLYRHWTLPEAVLALEHAERRSHAQLVVSLTGQQLAGASAWSKDAGVAFVAFCTRLQDRARGVVAREKKTRNADIASAFAGLGIPVQPA